jgi:hypothetical protein
MMKPRTTPPPGTATTTGMRIDEPAHRPAGLVLPGGVAQLQMNMRIHHKLRLALAGIGLACSAVLSAQEHLPKAPHGGILGDAGTHYIEMVLAGDEARFYLLDTLGNTLPVDGSTGTAYIRFNNRTTDNPEMVPDKKGYLRAALKSPYGFTVVPSIKLPSGFVSAQLTSGPREIPQPVEQHSPTDGHQH